MSGILLNWDTAKLLLREATNIFYEETDTEFYMCFTNHGIKIYTSYAKTDDPMDIIKFAEYYLKRGNMFRAEYIPRLERPEEKEEDEFSELEDFEMDEDANEDLELNLEDD